VTAREAEQMNAKDGQGAPSRQQTFDLMETLRVLDPKALEVEQTLAEGLTVSCPEFGRREAVAVLPCFPVTQPEHHVILRGSQGEELGLLEEVAHVPEPSRTALRQELAKQHFVPVITRVNAIYREFRIPIWEVETDRGPRRLALKSSHDARRLRGGRIYVRDAEGNGYLIPDYRELDPDSQNLVELFV
jgi:hypothetical protein